MFNINKHILIRLLLLSIVITFAVVPTLARAAKPTLGSDLRVIFKEYQSIEQSLMDASSMEPHSNGSTLKSLQEWAKISKTSLTSEADKILTTARLVGDVGTINEITSFKWLTIIENTTYTDNFEKDILSTIGKKDALIKPRLDGTPTLNKLLSTLHKEKSPIIFIFADRTSGPVGDYLSALGYYKASNLDKAAEMISKIPSSADIFPFSLILKAQIEYKANNSYIALEILESSLDGKTMKGPAKDKAHLMAGQIHFGNHNFNKARKHFDEVKSKSELYGQAQMAIVWTMIRQDNYLSANLKLNKLKEKNIFDQSFFEYATAEATILRGMNNFDEAEDVLTSAYQNIVSIEKEIKTSLANNDFTKIRNIITSDNKSSKKDNLNSYILNFLKTDPIILKAIEEHMGTKKQQKQNNKKLKKVNSKIAELKKSYRAKENFKKQHKIRIELLQSRLTNTSNFAFIKGGGKARLKPLDSEAKKIEKRISKLWKVKIKRNLTSMEQLFVKIIALSPTERQKCIEDSHKNTNRKITKQDRCIYTDAFLMKTVDGKNIIEKLASDFFTAAKGNSIVYQVKFKNTEAMINDNMRKDSKNIKQYNYLKKIIEANKSSLKTQRARTATDVDRKLKQRLSLVSYELGGAKKTLTSALKEIKNN